MIRSFGGMCCFWTLVRSDFISFISLFDSFHFIFFFFKCYTGTNVTNGFIETMEWTRPETVGDIPPPCRAHTATLVDRRLFIFGGGQANMYYNALYILDTVSRRWTHVPFTNPSPSPSSPSTATTDGTTSVSSIQSASQSASQSGQTQTQSGQSQTQTQSQSQLDAQLEDDVLPRPRRAHTTVLYKNRLVVFGGGNGAMALNDVWVLDVSVPPERMRWERQRTSGARPTPRGYHTANLVGNVMIVVGGSDGRQTFADIYCLNLGVFSFPFFPFLFSSGVFGKNAASS